jgi:hypothetical protein
MPDLTRPIAIVLPRFGLANRLRGVSSTIAIARRFKMPFGIVWEPGPGFSDARWQDLFANDYPLFDAAVVDAAARAGVPRASRWHRTPELDKPRAIRRAIRDRGFINDEGWHDLDWLLRERGVTLRGCRELRQRACRELRPAPAIAREIDAFTASHFDGHTVIGVHIRRGNDAMKGPHRGDFLASTDAAFVHAIDKISRERPDTRFFLATDCEETNDRFVEQYKGRVFSRAKQFVPTEFSAPMGAIPDAVCDLFLLSQTSRIIGNAGRSFSKQAARIGGIEMVCAEDV